MTVPETPSASPSPAASRPKVPVIPLQYHGKAGEVLKLHIVNLLLNIITLGIYSFWGKTRIRRYMTSHITIAKDRFEYTGTGKELLIGALKAFVIFLPLIICIQIPVVNFVALPIFFGVLSVAIYLAMRYRLSRTRWRGIRFALGGSIKEYLILSIKRTLINIFTLGWKIPKSDILKWSYIANHMQYGDINFSYEGDGTRLRKVHLTTLAIIIGVVFLPAVLGGIYKGQELIAQAKSKSQIHQVAPNNLVNGAAPYSGMPEETSVQPMDSYAEQEAGQVVEKKGSDSAIVGVILLVYAGFGIAFLARLWYHAALWQEKFRGLRLGKLRFKMDVTGGGLAKLYIVNILLIILTLGIAKPIAAHRTLRYFVSHLRIGGDINELIAEQSKAGVSGGFGDALAADVGFDLGL